jgi:hypothetical protein
MTTKKVMPKFEEKMFTESGQYTDLASDIDFQTSQLIRPLFEGWMKVGYSPRDIAHIMLHAVMAVELEQMMAIMYDWDTKPVEDKPA